MKKVYRKYGIALALLMVFALLKVTLVPNLQHTALYRPLKDGITTLGWVLVIYIGFWYLERRRWEDVYKRQLPRTPRDGRTEWPAPPWG